MDVYQTTQSSIPSAHSSSPFSIDVSLSKPDGAVKAKGKTPDQSVLPHACPNPLDSTVTAVGITNLMITEPHRTCLQGPSHTESRSVMEYVPNSRMDGVVSDFEAQAAVSWLSAHFSQNPQLPLFYEGSLISSVSAGCLRYSKLR